MTEQNLNLFEFASSAMKEAAAKEVMVLPLILTTDSDSE